MGRRDLKWMKRHDYVSEVFEVEGSRGWLSVTKAVKGMGRSMEVVAKTKQMYSRVGYRMLRESRMTDRSRARESDGMN